MSENYFNLVSITYLNPIFLLLLKEERLMYQIKDYHKALLNAINNFQIPTHMKMYKP